MINNHLSIPLLYMLINLKIWQIPFYKKHKFLFNFKFHNFLFILLIQYKLHFLIKIQIYKFNILLAIYDTHNFQLLNFLLILYIYIEIHPKSNQMNIQYILMYGLFLDNFYHLLNNICLLLIKIPKWYHNIYICSLLNILNILLSIYFDIDLISIALKMPLLFSFIKLKKKRGKN